MPSTARKGHPAVSISPARILSSQNPMLVRNSWILAPDSFCGILPSSLCLGLIFKALLLSKIICKNQLENLCSNSQ